MPSFARQLTTACGRGSGAAAYGRGESFPLTGSRIKEADAFLTTLTNAQHARDTLREREQAALASLRQSEDR